MRSLRLAAVVLLVALPLLAVAGEDAETAVRAGLDAYFRGQFDESAVELKRALRLGEDEHDPAVLAAPTYFLGRSFHELGLRGLALHYLGEAERLGGTEARRLARRELARIYFRAAEYPAVIQVFDRLSEHEGDGETAYLAGIAAAMLERWPQAEAILGAVRPGDPFYGYALCARAQARAAAGDFVSALADLDGIGAMAALPEGLRDQSQILRGKILYLEGRDAEARLVFAALEKRGTFAFEAMRGLLITGAGVNEAAQIEPPASRPEAAATLLMVKAVAAEERDDASKATELREQMREIVQRRMEALKGLATPGGTSEIAVHRDLAEFAGLLRRQRWALGCGQERGLLSAELSRSVAAPPSPDIKRFQPSEGEFYAVWDQARTDSWLRGLIELLSRSDGLAHDLESAGSTKPLWMFWRRRDDERSALALLAIRIVNLEQLFADHRHTFRGLRPDELRAVKGEGIEQTVDELRALFLGRSAKIPTGLSNLETTLDYKRLDIRRLIEAVPERSTDPVISLLGNTMDLLADLRERMEKSRAEVSRETGREELVGALGVRNSRLRAKVGAEIHRAAAPTLRRQMAFLTRLEADNEGSLSKLYARSAAAAGKGGSQ